MENNKDKINEIVSGFKTRYKKGFLDTEIKELLKTFPMIKIREFSIALGVNTCFVVKGKYITYHGDVERAIRCCIEKRGIKLEEFD